MPPASDTSNASIPSAFQRLRRRFGIATCTSVGDGALGDASTVGVVEVLSHRCKALHRGALDRADAALGVVEVGVLIVLEHVTSSVVGESVWRGDGAGAGLANKRHLVVRIVGYRGRRGGSLRRRPFSGVNIPALRCGARGKGLHQAS